MKSERLLAITLKSIPFEDRSQIITGLTENQGLVSAVARNSVQSRRFGGALELFTAAHWDLVWKEGAELHRLDSAEAQKSFTALAKDYKKFLIASCFAELTLRLAVHGQAAPDWFRLLSNALTGLEEMNSGDFRFLTAFISKALQISGISPSFVRCLTCGNELTGMDPSSSIEVSILQGGFLCADCKSASPFEMVRVAVAYDYMKAQELPIRKTMEEALGVEKEHLKFILFLEKFAAYHVPGMDRTPLQSFRAIESLK